MTRHSSMPNSPIAPKPGSTSGAERFDLSPLGLADAPANQQDSDSIVYVGNS